jgi:hypothetical protein
MSDQITAAFQADDVYELIGFFASLDESPPRRCNK